MMQRCGGFCYRVKCFVLFRMILDSQEIRQSLENKGLTCLFRTILNLFLCVLSCVCVCLGVCACMRV